MKLLIILSLLVLSFQVQIKKNSNSQYSVVYPATTYYTPLYSIYYDYIWPSYFYYYDLYSPTYYTYFYRKSGKEEPKKEGEAK